MSAKTPMEELFAALEADKDLELPMDPAFYDRLHDKIMAGVEKTEMEHPAWYEKPQKYLRGHWRSWSLFGGSLSVLLLSLHLSAGLVTKSLHGSHAVTAARQEDRLLDQALKAPDALSRSILISQTESEFFVDLADSSFEDLSIDKFNRIMGEAVN